MSDHGDNIGEHGLSQNGQCMSRSPACRRYSGRPAVSREGGASSKSASFLISVRQSSTSPERNIRNHVRREVLPALKFEEWSGREFVFSEQVADVAMTVAIVITNWVNTWYDPPKEKESADALLRAGADIIANHLDAQRQARNP
jgi:arylsulfatase